MATRPMASGDDFPGEPQVFVINLDERTDRWATISATCSAAGLAATRVPGIRTSPGWVGCGQSHANCILRAKQQGLPWVLILEDDAVFTPEAIDRFRALLPYLWRNRDKWERFNGGPTLPSDPFVRLLDRDQPILYARGYCSHFMMAHAGAYDVMIDWEPARDREYDAFLVGLETRFRTVFNSVCTYPHIATQDASPSNVSPNADASAVDYSSYFAYSEYKLRECLQNG